ncbi:MAG: hypothetical protein GY913_14390 [Proteobacteria bacterium]|nr:hypothetical protein [Pseudomonadota bacterium]MCP4918098.1 hypothetical protein [Pseudomonadota bacterium]
MTVDLRLQDQLGTRVVYQLGNAVRLAASQPEHLAPVLDALQRATRSLLGSVGPSELRFERGAAWLNDHLLRTGGGMGIQLTTLYRMFASKGLSGLKVRPGVSAASWTEALRRVLSAPQVAKGGSATTDLLGATGLDGVRFLPLGRGPDARRRELRAAADIDLYGRALDRVSTLFVEEGGVQAFSRVAQELVAATLRDPRHLVALVTLPMEVAYEIRHPVNTAILTLAVGRHLGLSRGALLDLCLCAFSADSGMADVPREILEKIQPLSQSEKDRVRRHPLDSVRRVLADPRLDRAARRRLVVAFEHHIEGTHGGYPRVFGWSRQHIYSRIVSVCDAFDAMIADKPWRPALLADEALAQLVVEAGARLDPALVVALAETLGRFPVGTAVLLDSGEVAVVHSPASEDADPTRPVVRVILTTSGGRSPDQRAVALAREAPGGRRAVRSVDAQALGINTGEAVFGGLGLGG